MVTIKTERLNLREFVGADFADVFAYESDPKVVKYVSYGPYTEEEGRRDLNWHIAHQNDPQRRFYYLAIEFSSEKRVIGFCGLKLKEVNAQEAELSYAMNRDYWGQGYMSEATSAMVNFAFRDLTVHRVFGGCCPENVGSARVMEKVGLKQEGYLRENSYFKGRWWDTLIFGILEHEWDS